MTSNERGRAYERSYVLDDISIRSGGDGRTVVALAAVFDRAAEVQDQDGHYYETITRGAFEKTLVERAGQIQVFYNHGKTLFGTPSERFSIPIGTPEEIREDARGLVTVTRYNRTPLADEILESIGSGSIKGQSFSGRFLPGRSQRSPGQNGDLDTIVRTEVMLREYGPTPIPVYKDAAILGVRMEELVDTLQGLNAEERAELFRLMDTPQAALGAPSPAVDAAPSGTSPANDTPPAGHLSSIPAERRLAVLNFRQENAA